MRPTAEVINGEKQTAEFTKREKQTTEIAERDKIHYRSYYWRKHSSKITKKVKNKTLKLTKEGKQTTDITRREKKRPHINIHNTISLILNERNNIIYNTLYS